tara:strand:- start:432 stop:551 length:120 start_codon:yes stop_codon:yes gene_type:complete
VSFLLTGVKNGDSIGRVLGIALSGVTVIAQKKRYERFIK